MLLLEQNISTDQHKLLASSHLSFLFSQHREKQINLQPRAKAGEMESGGRKEEEVPAAAKAQRGAASFGVSVQEWFQHVKASLVGVVRKATARSEQEAAEADMRVAKEQVEATDEAEAKKKQLGA